MFIQLYCYNSASDAVALGSCIGFETLWLQFGILAGRALTERQCTLEGEAQYVNYRVMCIEGNVQGGGVDTGGCKFF